MLSISATNCVFSDSHKTSLVKCLAEIDEKPPTNWKFPCRPLRHMNKSPKKSSGTRHESKEMLTMICFINFKRERQQFYFIFSYFGRAREGVNLSGFHSPTHFKEMRIRNTNIYDRCEYKKVEVISLCLISISLMKSIAVCRLIHNSFFVPNSIIAH